MAKQSLLSERLFGGACLFYWLSSAFMVVYGLPHYKEPAWEPWTHHLLEKTGAIGDPVLQFICKAIIVVVAVLYLPGVIIAALVIAALALLFIIGQFVFEKLMILAAMSPTGALVAWAIILVVSAILACILWFILTPVRTLVMWVAKWVWLVAYGLLFDWWLTPILTRQKGRMLMNDVERARAQYEASITRLRSQCPEIADIPLSAEPANWISQVAERFRDRQAGKTLAEKTRLLEQTKQFFAEYRAALDAQDEFRRFGDRKEEKDDEAELRRLERLKRKLQLEREIQELSNPSDSSYQGKFDASRKRRLVDIQNEVFLEFQRQIEKDITLRLTYNDLVRKIQNHPDLSSDQKNELLQKLKDTLNERESPKPDGKPRPIPIYKKEA